MLLQTGGVAVRLAALLSNNVQGALLSSRRSLRGDGVGYLDLEGSTPP